MSRSRCSWASLVAVAIALLLLLLYTSPAVALEPGAPSSDQTAIVELAPIPPEAQATPLDVEAATKAYLATMPASAQAASDSYFEGGYWLQLWGFLSESAIGIFLLHAGISFRLRQAAARWTRFRALHVAAYWVGYVVLTTALGLPLAAYAGYFREHQYGLSNMSFGGWLGDQGKQLIIGAVVGAVAMPLLYAIVTRAKRQWWLWGAVASVAIGTVMIAIAPYFLAPLFNTYRPITDARISAPILAMARGNGITVHDVYEFDASRQSNRVGANVSGFGGSSRISLNDTLLRRASLPEIEAVMGHEMGHYVMHHIEKDLAFVGIIIVVGFAFVNAAFERLRARFASRWKVTGIDDVAGLPLVMLLFGGYIFALTPLLNTLTRTGEIEADMFGLNTARQPDGQAQIAIKLGEYRKMSPGPIEELVFFDHPSGRSRIRTAMQWKAEHTGSTPLQPLP